MPSQTPITGVDAVATRADHAAGIEPPVRVRHRLEAISKPVLTKGWLALRRDVLRSSLDDVNNRKQSCSEPSKLVIVLRLSTVSFSVENTIKGLHHQIVSIKCCPLGAPTMPSME